MAKSKTTSSSEAPKAEKPPRRLPTSPTEPLGGSYGEDGQLKDRTQDSSDHPGPGDPQKQED